MIFGFKIEVSALEARELLSKRSEVLRTRASTLSDKLTALDRAQHAVRDVVGVDTCAQVQRPAERIQQTVKDLQRGAEYYAFLADHVVQGATYQLPLNEAAALFGYPPNACYGEEIGMMVPALLP